MNSLNILSARVIGQTPQSPRSRSVGEGSRRKDETSTQPRRSASQHAIANTNLEKIGLGNRTKQEEEDHKNIKDEAFDEKTPLLEKPVSYHNTPAQGKSKSRLLVKRLANALVESIRWILSKLVSPSVYVWAHFHDDHGRFSAFMPFQRVRRKPSAKSSVVSPTHTLAPPSSTESSDSDVYSSENAANRSLAEGRTVTPATSDSELDSSNENGADTRGNKNKNGSSQGGENVPTRRSIRIKLNNEESTRRKKGTKKSSGLAQSTRISQEEAAAAELKSPTSPASSLGIAKYPRSPAPPRPLIPRRQPSYSNLDSKRPRNITQKTLVIDLDETLIHSLAKGGRMSSGHMVEVKLPQAASFNGLSLGPQHPILYYVHKRPNCDEFLRKVCKWYNLVAFTASVQEYADPVIDWLEQEKKYFSARYYRQHCTFRNGAYIKDLSSVEPDLSKVMILDNSPLSYIFHEGS